MNQVTEMLQLAPGAAESDAVARLSTLFQMMGSATGFRSAEILRNVASPDLLLVMHAWDRIEDWQAFQSSDAKVTFSASRPPSLYTFVPCGMNWREDASAGRGEGPYLRREVVRGATAPRSGPDIASSQIFTYQDYEPDFKGTTLRLTRLSSVHGDGGPPAHDLLADETYESIYRHAVVDEQASVAG